MNRPTFDSYRWHSEIFKCESTDISHFFSLLEEEKNRLGLIVQKLGDVGGEPIWLMQSPAQNSANPNLLISAGFHGEEAAGPWGMLNFLSNLNPSLFEKVNLSLLPLINPTGFANGHRFNVLGENPNRGFYIKDGIAQAGEHTSVEGKILIDHSNILLSASRDGILTCHEDVLLTDTYVYTFEPTQVPGKFSYNLRDALGQYFPIAKDGNIDDCPVRNGVIFNHFDSSFESFLVQQGARIGCCSETPGQQNLDQRILANAAVMTTFVKMAQVPSDA